MFPFILLQGITTILASYFYKYIQHQTDTIEDQNKKIQVITKKLENMESHISLLRQNIDDLDEKIIENNSLIKSSTDLNNQLHEFVHYTYDFGDSNSL
jgi:peptidoglycan hydrolase CwlO-like protein